MIFFTITGILVWSTALVVVGGLFLAHRLAKIQLRRLAEKQAVDTSTKAT